MRRGLQFPDLPAKPPGLENSFRVTFGFVLNDLFIILRLFLLLSVFDLIFEKLERIWEIL